MQSRESSFVVSVELSAEVKAEGVTALADLIVVWLGLVYMWKFSVLAFQMTSLGSVFCTMSNSV